MGGGTRCTAEELGKSDVICVCECCVSPRALTFLWINSSFLTHIKIIITQSLSNKLPIDAALTSDQLVGRKQTMTVCCCCTFAAAKVA